MPFDFFLDNNVYRRCVQRLYNRKIPSLLAGFFHFSFALPVSKRKKAIFALSKNNRAYMDNIDLPEPQTEKDGKNFWKNLFRTILGTTLHPY